jgi:hypothetical protein
MTRRGMSGLHYAMTTLKLAAEAATDADARRMMGLLVVAGMVALVLKGLLIGRWVRARKKAREQRQVGNEE